MKKKINRSGQRYWIVAFFLVLLLLLAGIFVFAYVQRFGSFYGGEQDVWGQFGDYVGGILNPVLSFCAFVGLQLTLRFQAGESVKVELRQADQQFDARLFQLLSLLNTSLSSVQLDKFDARGRQAIVGHGAIKLGWKKLESGLEAIEDELLDDALYSKFLVAFRGWSDTFGDRMISYYDTLLFMLLYVRKESEGENQGFALRAISSQLGQEARILLLYMIIFSGNKSLYNFLEAYNYWPGEETSATFPHARRLIKILKGIR
ncbi:hypothetical protein [Pseudomonas syringae]|uniref:hypothetical protein n=1 Tax=Pseudomonas syringae TaxID=317 RepID=UPI0023F9427D|nr:hypothetical protein [Pseudomonas syringae]MDF5774058.1 hypothetical protein [Pseudomonas syringae pv. syringae]